MITRSKSGIYKPKTFISVIQDLEPTSVKEALVDQKWYMAMKDEYSALQRNET